MKKTHNVIAASIALLFAASAYAQSSGSSSGQAMSKQEIDQQHKAAMEKCDGMKDNAKDICKAEADGQRKIAEAQAKVSERDTPKNRLELSEAKAEATYKVAKERCDDQVGDAKSACEKQAKASRDLAVAEAKKQAQTETSTGGSGTGSSASGQSGSAGAGQPPASSSGSSGTSGTSSSQPGTPGADQSQSQPSGSSTSGSAASGQPMPSSSGSTGTSGASGTGQEPARQPGQQSR